MFCKNCGSEVAEGSKFCFSCGCAMEEPTPQPVVIAQEEAVPTGFESSTQEPAELNAVPSEPAEFNAAPTESLQMKIKSFIEKNKLLLVGACGVLALIVCICIIIVLCSGGNGYIAYENAILANVQDDEIVVLWNNKVVETNIEASYLEDQATNLDGTVFAALTDEGTLFFVKNKKTTIVAEDVTTFVLSSGGNGIGYVVADGDEYSLNLYNVSKKKNTVVTDAFSEYAASFYSFDLAPDGKSMAYYDYDEEEDEATLIFFNGKKNSEITSSEVELVGLSNKGKYIYAIGEDSDGDDVLYAYNKNGDREKLGACSSSTFYFNDDHTQILFYNDSKSYICAKAKEANKISSGIAYLITSDGSSLYYGENSFTAPVEDLYGHVYVCYNDGKYNIWNIKKNSDKSAKLVSNVDDWKLDADAKYLYYINDDSELCVLKISHGDNASDKAKTLAEDVEKYVVTSNRSKVYYISEDSLYSCNGKNGKNEKTIASDDVDSSYLAINAKDVVYYILDGDAYACSNGKKGTKVLSDAEVLIGYPNGVVYSANEDTIYVTTGAKKLKKLLDME